jgi:hypothetical protein
MKRFMLLAALMFVLVMVVGCKKDEKVAEVQPTEIEKQCIVVGMEVLSDRKDGIPYSKEAAKYSMFKGSKYGEMTQKVSGYVYDIDITAAKPKDEIKLFCKGIETRQYAKQCP